MAAFGGGAPSLEPPKATFPMTLPLASGRLGASARLLDRAGAAAAQTTSRPHTSQSTTSVRHGVRKPQTGNARELHQRRLDLGAEVDFGDPPSPSPPSATNVYIATFTGLDMQQAPSQPRPEKARAPPSHSVVNLFEAHKAFLSPTEPVITKSDLRRWRRNQVVASEPSLRPVELAPLPGGGLTSPPSNHPSTCAPDPASELASTPIRSPSAAATSSSLLSKPLLHALSPPIQLAPNEIHCVQPMLLYQLPPAPSTAPPQPQRPSLPSPISSSAAAVVPACRPEVRRPSTSLPKWPPQADSAVAEPSSAGMLNLSNTTCVPRHSSLSQYHQQQRRLSQAHVAGPQYTPAAAIGHDILVCPGLVRVGTTCDGMTAADCMQPEYDPGLELPPPSTVVCVSPLHSPGDDVCVDGGAVSTSAQLSRAGSGKAIVMVGRSSIPSPVFGAWHSSASDGESGSAGMTSNNHAGSVATTARGVTRSARTSNGSSGKDVSIAGANAEALPPPSTSPSDALTLEDYWDDAGPSDAAIDAHLRALAADMLLHSHAHGTDGNEEDSVDTW